MLKLNAKELRDVDENVAEHAIHEIKRNPIFFILDNVYDTYNIGGLFRLADGLAIEKMYICGSSEIPPNPRIAKASVGTYKVVPWEYKETASDAIKELRMRSEEIEIIAVEQSDTSVPYTHIEYTSPVAIILGNETFGVAKETLDLCDYVAEIPMWGINKSLNVIISAGIVGYHIKSKIV
ncbi:MAG: TrmH family RNA methyltransferase [Candidatus Roizmanbacteria bacterium]